MSDSMTVADGLRDGSGSWPLKIRCIGGHYKRTALSTAGNSTAAESPKTVLHFNFILLCSTYYLLAEIISFTNFDFE